MENETIITKSIEETLTLGSQFANKLKPGDIVALSGDLGTGKTEFIKGICNFFKVEEIVNSPTFTIINQYNGRKKGVDIPIMHIDLYRIKSNKELINIGLNEQMHSDTMIKLIEWAENANGSLPPVTYKISICSPDNSESKRAFTFQPAFH
ncbi:MAG: tRNA (adenosine(37)-N6)-threonylcarbamoyltransferase complex ATPase subunit type 1 TsaE [Bacteroidota bacterium]